MYNTEGLVSRRTTSSSCKICSGVIGLTSSGCSEASPPPPAESLDIKTSEPANSPPAESKTECKRGNDVARWEKQTAGRSGKARTMAALYGRLPFSSSRKNPLVKNRDIRE